MRVSSSSARFSVSTARVNKLRAVVEGDDADPWRQPGCKSRDLRFDTVDHVNGADPIACHHDATDGLCRAFDQGARPERLAHLHLRHLAYKDGDAVLCTDDDLLDIAQALDEPQAANDGPGATRLDDIAPDVAIAPHHRVDDGRKRDPEGAQAVRVHVDLILPDHTPDTRHLSNPRDSVKLITDEPVLQRPQVLQRVALPFHGVPEDMTDACRIGAKRRDNARRQGLPHQVQPLQDPRASKVDIHRVFKNNVNHREAKGRGRAHHPHAG